MIYKVEGNRIFIAADNRASLQRAGHQSTSDTTCKIHLIGRTVLAVAGEVAHYHGPISPSTLDWDAFVDADLVAKMAGEDPNHLAKRWGIQIASQIRAYLDLDPQSKDEMLRSSSSRNAVIAGVFARTDFGTPNVEVEYVTILKAGMDVYPAASPPIGIESSTNAISQELIEGKTARARDAARRWAKEAKSKKYSGTELSWRHMEFLVLATSEYDTGVSRTSDVIEILPSGQIVWLSNPVCHQRGSSKPYKRSNRVTEP